MKTNRDGIALGGFAPSASGGLHASSVGEHYPWSVQPRLESTDDWSWNDGHWRTVWVAFNALDGFEGHHFDDYDDAVLDMLCWIAEEDDI